MSWVCVCRLHVTATVICSIRFEHHTSRMPNRTYACPKSRMPSRMSNSMSNYAVCFFATFAHQHLLGDANIKCSHTNNSSLVVRLRSTQFTIHVAHGRESQNDSCNILTEPRCWMWSSMGYYQSVQQTLALSVSAFVSVSASVSISLSVSVSVLIYLYPRLYLCLLLYVYLHRSI